ncbi:MAG: hypothetical protein JW719_11640, partial [Pirellulales bacterium]|nr:hypothetical protein [Pirellulales bacterium]
MTPSFALFRRHLRFTLLASIALATIFAAAPWVAGQSLESDFQSPPDAARPWVYWFWMNGNLTRQGITADLEAMKRAGIGGTLIMSVSTGIPPGKVEFLSPEWREWFAFAASEADRLGLQIIMNNDDGWTGSGGPWNTVENSMQVLTASETRVEGPKRLDMVLPRPPAKLDYYRDIALLAIPRAPEEADSRDFAPKTTAGDPKCEAARLTDNDVSNPVQLTSPTPEKPAWIDIVFDKPFRAQSISIGLPPGWHVYTGSLMASDDGKTFREVAPVAIRKYSLLPFSEECSFDPVEARRFRLVFNSVGNRAPAIPLTEIALTATPRIKNWAAKAAYSRADGMEPNAGPSSEPAVHAKAIVDLTDKLEADGRLQWNVPEGRWTLLRLGHTTNAKKNHPGTPQGEGLECDKLSKEALDAHFDGFMAKLIAGVGPLAGKSLVGTHTDSWEVGCQNWTAKLREEF